MSRTKQRSTKSHIGSIVFPLCAVAAMTAATVVYLGRLYHISNDYEYDWYYTGAQLISGYTQDGIQISGFNFLGVLTVAGFIIGAAAAAVLLVMTVLSIMRGTEYTRAGRIATRTAALAITASSILMLLFEPIAKSTITAEGTAYLAAAAQNFAFNYYPSPAAVGMSVISLLFALTFIIKGFGKTKFWAKSESAVYLSVIIILVLYFWQYGYLHKLFGIETSSSTFPYPFAHAVNSYSKLTGGIKGSYNSVFGSFRTLLQHSVSTALDDSIFHNSVTTVAAMMIGFVLGGLVGYGVAILATACPRWGRGVLTICSILVAFPVVALGPIANHWFPSDSYLYSFIAKIIVVTILCMAGMTVNAYKGLKKTKPYAMDLMLVCSATPGTIFTKLQFHNSLPNVFTALKVNTATALMGAFVCEFYSRSKTYGIGMWFNYYWQNARYQAWVYILVIIVYGLALYQIVSAVEKRCIHWHASQRKN